MLSSVYKWRLFFIASHPLFAVNNKQYNTSKISTKQREEQLLSTCVDGGALPNFFPLATTHAKVANSGSGKMVIARYRMRYFFQKREPLPLSLLEN